jgi:hypothetical protein
MVEATASVYRCKLDYEDLNMSKSVTPGNHFRPVDALTKARTRARQAQEAFEEHVKEHRCSA